MDNVAEAPCVLRLPATEFLLPLLLPTEAVSIAADTLPEEEVEEPEFEEASAKRARWSCTTRPVASVSQSICITDGLSIIRDFVEHVGVDV